MKFQIDVTSDSCKIYMIKFCKIKFCKFEENDILKSANRIAFRNWALRIVRSSGKIGLKALFEKNRSVFTRAPYDT